MVIDVPVYEDRALLGNLVQQTGQPGRAVPVAEMARRLNVPLARAGDIVFQPRATRSADRRTDRRTRRLQRRRRLTSTSDP